MTFDSMECETCKAKPGSPLLCAACLHNRNLVARLKRSIISLMTSLEAYTQKEETDLYRASKKAINEANWVTWQDEEQER